MRSQPQHQLSTKKSQTCPRRYFSSLPMKSWLCNLNIQRFSYITRWLYPINSNTVWCKWELHLTLPIRFMRRILRLNVSYAWLKGQFSCWFKKWVLILLTLFPQHIKHVCTSNSFFHEKSVVFTLAKDVFKEHLVLRW